MLLYSIGHYFSINLFFKVTSSCFYIIKTLQKIIDIFIAFQTSVETQQVYPNFLRSRSDPARKELKRMLRIHRNVTRTTSPPRTTTTALHTIVMKWRKTKKAMRMTKNVRFCFRHYRYTNTDDVKLVPLCGDV